VLKRLEIYFLAPQSTPDVISIDALPLARPKRIVNSTINGGKSLTKDQPPVWQMIRQAIDEIGPKTTNIEVRDRILARWPDTNKTRSPARYHVLEGDIAEDLRSALEQIEDILGDLEERVGQV
jgi:hypothetical protein